MIATAQVMAALQPWLGARLSHWMAPLMEEMALKMNAYSTRNDPKALRDELDSMLFQALRHFTRGTMLAEISDGSWVRIQIEDIAMMADELMLLIFDQFSVDSHHLLLLRDYSMGCASLSALRVLYTRFAPLQSEQELQAIAGVIRACHPAFRWRQWLT
ncbi:MAG: hypothetical protein IJD39_04070 [Clostridia bacterium]|nr:hypothetical protein [Clostridia bacterium]